jgi:hypothetical protein
VKVAIADYDAIAPGGTTVLGMKVCMIHSKITHRPARSPLTLQGKLSGNPQQSEDTNENGMLQSSAAFTTH